MAATSGLILPLFPKAAFSEFVKKERNLRFYNIHTNENLNACYWRNGAYLDNELLSINHFFRDFRTGEIKPIDAKLLDLLYVISRKVGQSATIHLISGYRSPKTNEMLRHNGSGVAKKSLHMKGYAADIRIPGIKTTALKTIAVGLAAGGVGYYPKSDFVHVDIGRVRQW